MHGCACDLPCDLRDELMTVMHRFEPRYSARAAVACVRHHVRRRVTIEVQVFVLRATYNTAVLGTLLYLTSIYRYRDFQCVLNFYY